MEKIITIFLIALISITISCRKKSPDELFYGFKCTRLLPPEIAAEFKLLKIIPVKMKIKIGDPDCLCIKEGTFSNMHFIYKCEKLDKRFLIIEGRPETDSQ